MRSPKVNLRSRIFAASPAQYSGCSSTSGRKKEFQTSAGVASPPGDLPIGDAPGDVTLVFFLEESLCLELSSCLETSSYLN